MASDMYNNKISFKTLPFDFFLQKVVVSGDFYVFSVPHLAYIAASSGGSRIHMTFSDTWCSLNMPIEKRNTAF